MLKKETHRKSETNIRQKYGTHINQKYGTRINTDRNRNLKKEFGKISTSGTRTKFQKKRSMQLLISKH